MSEKHQDTGPRVSVNRDRGREAGADRIAGGALLQPTDRPANTPAPPALRLGPGVPLPPPERSYFERRLGTDLSAVRVHPDAPAAAALGARAFASGRDIGFAPGAFRAGSGDFRQLLGHELGHVIQQGSSGPSVQLQEAPPTTATPPAATPPASTPPAATPPATATPAASTAPGPPTNAPAHTDAPTPAGGEPAAAPIDAGIRLIPPDWVRESGERDILTARIGNQMVALPASGTVVLLVGPQQSGVAPPEQLLSLASIAKEGLVAVNVGGRTGFMLDAGGTPAVVFPVGIAAMQQALGITTFRGVAVTHIHDDHVQSFVRIVQQFGITPRNLHYPAAFAVNVAAPTSTFARQLQAVQSDPALRALGHGPTAAYSAIPTPTGGAFFHQTVREGQVNFDFYGLTREFQELEAQRTAGQALTKPDTASLLTRVTHQASGSRWLYVGDLRGSDLTLFRQAMGDAAYNEMLSGVRIIVGLQHHLGTLAKQAARPPRPPPAAGRGITSRDDREGLVDLLARTYVQNASLTVLAQSQENYPGAGQFLNRSLIKALTEAGIDVHVALEPGAGGQVSTVTATNQGITATGGGRTESHPGSPELQRHMGRLTQLREAEEVLTKYEKFLTEPGRQSASVRAAREALEQSVIDYVRTVIGGVRTGSAGRQQASLDNPAAQEAALNRVRTASPVEDMLTPANMTTLRDLNRIGPHRVVYEEELAAARRTGKMSERGIEALWEFEPAAARDLVGRSGLERVEQARILAQTPGQPMPAGTRVMGGVLLAVAVIQEVAPLIQAEQARSFDENVAATLRDIMWWQSKGVFPRIQALNASVLPGRDEWTQDPKRVQQLIDSKDIDFLVILGIDDPVWDAFTIWASTHLHNLPDWDSFILNAHAIRSQGQFMDNQTWEFRKATIAPGTLHGHNIVEQWEPNDRLTRILQAAARDVLAVSKQQIAAVGTGPGPYGGPAYKSADKYSSQEIFAGKPKAVGQKTFKSGIASPGLYTIANQHRVRGFDADARFFVFPKTASPDPIPSGYILVGGADFNTYAAIYETRNFVRGGAEYDQLIEPNTLEVLLAEADDLRDVP